LSRLALTAGAEALNDSNWMRRNVAKIVRTREATVARLRKLGFQVPDSAANFVLAKLPGHDLSGLTRALRRSGILVRHFANPLLYDAIRISIGTPAEMNALFKAMRPHVAALTESSLNGGRPGR
jgi:histidinol-phosphate aminotransferase